MRILLNSISDSLLTSELLLRVMSLLSDFASKVLIDPIRDGCNALWIVSGYSSPAMFYRHREMCREVNLAIPEISLVIGMTAREGMNRVAHQGFIKATRIKSGLFECRYVTTGRPVHSKVYAWTRDGEPVRGFVGSANYSQNAFEGAQVEVMHEINPIEAEAYVSSILTTGVLCTEERIEDYMTLHDDPSGDFSPHRNLRNTAMASTLSPSFVDLALTTGTGGGEEVPPHSGLNWGQRLDRNPNEAYLAVSADIQRSGFFPRAGEHFTVLTDNGEVFDCVRAQANGKAIETPESNAILGDFFRRRLGLGSGAPVTLGDLNRYGRKSVRFTRVSETEFRLDFSQPSN